MQRLLGLTLQGIEVTRNKKSITFVTKDGKKLIYDTEGDNCSHTWIESVEEKESVLGFPILKIISHIIATNQIEEGREVDVYNYELQTMKGACTIDFRNTSDGYYGGYLEFRETVEGSHNVEK